MNTKSAKGIGPGIGLRVVACGVVLMLAGCGNDEMTQGQIRELNAKLDGMTAKLQAAEKGQAEALGEIEKLKLAVAKAEDNESDPSSMKFPVLEESKLKSGLLAFVAEKEEEITRIIKNTDSEVSKIGEKSLDFPVVFTHPYSARVDVKIRKGEREVTVPLVFRADWEGIWFMPGEKEICKRVVQHLELPAATTVVDKTALATDNSNKATTLGAPPAPPAPQPRPINPPLPPGVNVREIDLRGQKLFDQGGGR